MDARNDINDNVENAQVVLNNSFSFVDMDGVKIEHKNEEEDSKPPFTAETWPDIKCSSDEIKNDINEGNDLMDNVDIKEEPLEINVYKDEAACPNPFAPRQHSQQAKGNVPGNKCQYLGCNKSKIVAPDLKLFRFPLNQDICQQWIVNSGNVALQTMCRNSVIQKHICEEHFRREDISKNKFRCRLKKHAVPIRYRDILSDLHQPDESGWFRAESPAANLLTTPDDEETTETIDFSINKEVGEIVKAVVETSHQTESLSNEDDLQDQIRILRNAVSRSFHKQKRLQERFVCCKKKLNRCQDRLAYANRKLRKYRGKEYNVLDSIKYPSSNSKMLVEMQVLPKRKNTWTQTQKQFALDLYRTSPMAYKFLIKQEIVLPSISCIRRWKTELELDK